jgi:multidrug resistance efflux pump
LESVSWRRAIGYSVYAVLAGMYSYFLLLFFVRVLYHILYFYSPQWAFLPAGLLALRIFRSRIRKFGIFMKELYLAKREWLLVRRPRLVVAAVALLVLGIVPLRRVQVREPFIAEPVQRAVVRAQVPALVTSVAVMEGQRVDKGAEIARLEDVSVQSETARATANFRTAEAVARDAQLNYTGYAEAAQRLREAGTKLALARDKQQRLSLVSPVAGVVVTPRVGDIAGSYVGAGTTIAEIADMSAVRARIFVPEYEMKDLNHIHDVVLRFDSSWTSVPAKLVAISPASEVPDEALVARAGYKGMKLPEFFVVTVELANPSGTVRDGMTGTARIYAERRGIIPTVLEPLTTAIARRFW